MKSIIIIIFMSIIVSGCAAHPKEICSDYGFTFGTTDAGVRWPARRRKGRIQQLGRIPAIADTKTRCRLPGFFGMPAARTSATTRAMPVVVEAARELVFRELAIGGESVGARKVSVASSCLDAAPVREHVIE